MDSIIIDYLNKEKNNNVYEIECLIKKSEFKGIVVYPRAVKWEPQQRPHHILREFAKLGYLCFFIDGDYISINDNLSKGIVYEEKYKNFYNVYDDLALLYALQTYNPIVLCTWIIQLNWIDFLPNKFIWYDVLDRIDFFSQYDEDYLRRHNNLVKTAEFVSYTADNLHDYVKTREDAVLIPNAVNKEDFEIENDRTIEALEEIKDKKIVGYFGAIEEWFDSELIESLAKEEEDYEIVLIGQVGIDINHLNKYKNIKFMGKIPHNELKYYCKYFDVFIIPFKVNDLTNSVSPIKLFEYCALGKPIVSTDIHEVKKYKSKGIYIADNKNKFIKRVKRAMRMKKPLPDLQTVVENNSWQNRVEEFLNINNNYDFLKCSADLVRNDSVDLHTATFLDANGYNYFSGGAERYINDLYSLFGKFNIDFNVYQWGEYQWVRRIDNINIISLAKGVEKLDLSVEGVQGYGDDFYDYSSYSKLAIYSPFFFKGKYTNKNAIGISHGVGWDNEYVNHKNGEQFWNANKHIIDSGKSFDNIVSVDTNTANWFQTIDYKASRKFHVIPNYVDTNIFNPTNKKNNEDKIIIAYPRRLYAPRGLYFVLNILDELMGKYSNIELHFVGKGETKDIEKINEKINKWGDRVKCYSLLPENMIDIYNISDIVLIPTIYSEGTSLSCLEAMATKNAIISTRVGGLTDLIIDRYNGILINPNEKDLKEALIQLIENKDLRELYAQNAMRVSTAFSKEIWEQKWVKFISKVIELKDCNESKNKSPYIKIYADKETCMESDFKKNIKALLDKKCLVDIKTNMEEDFIRKNSYGRLQFEKIESNNYHDYPEYIVDTMSLGIKESISFVELFKILNN